MQLLRLLRHRQHNQSRRENLFKTMFGDVVVFPSIFCQFIHLVINEKSPLRIERNLKRLRSAIWRGKDFVLQEAAGP